MTLHVDTTVDMKSVLFCLVQDNELVSKESADNRSNNMIAVRITERFDSGDVFKAYSNANRNTKDKNAFTNRVRQSKGLNVEIETLTRGFHR